VPDVASSYLQPGGSELNNRGFTLVEVIVAGCVFLTVIASFGYLLKFSKEYVIKTDKNTREFYKWRSGMERLRATGFDRLAATGTGETLITPLSEDLCLVRVGDLYTLRSKY
jgi:hypothetical protein